MMDNVDLRGIILPLIVNFDSFLCFQVTYIALLTHVHKRSQSYTLT